MSAKYDGSIRIDTKIDSKTADKGLSTLTKSLKGFATAVVAAFSLKAVIDFGKAAVSAATDLENAMIGLKSILDGQGRSFEQANKFIQAYISDGLVPASNAVTAYKNLLMRGYNTKQIEDVMNRLKDSAAFGRQASYSLGDAVTSATEGLKNENSILVDNAGVTKNVAKMWDEYAKSIGTTANKLTQAQKIQAEYVGIMNETKYQVGDAQKITQTYSGQVAMLTFGFTNLKVALGNAIIPVLQAILPHINAIIAGLTRLANQLASFSGGIFGKAVVTDSAKEAKASVDGLTDSIGASGDAAKKAGKDAEKGLAAFDDLLTQTDTSGVAAGGAGVADAVMPTIDPAATEDALRDAIESAFDMSNYTWDITRVKIAWNGLKERFGEIAQQIMGQFDDVNIGGAGLRTVLSLLYAIINTAKLVIGVAGDLIVAFNVPATVQSALELLATTFETIGRVIASITPGVQAFAELALVPIAEWIGGKVRDAFAFLAEQLTKVGDWFVAHQEDFTNLGTRLGEIGAAIWDIVEPIADAAWETAKTIIAGIVDGLLAFGDWCFENEETVSTIATVIGSFAAAWVLVNAAITTWNIIGAIATGVTGAFGAAVTILTSPVTLVIAAIGALIAIIVLLVQNWDTVKEVASNVWAWIVSVWDAVATWFDENIVQPVSKAFATLKENVTKAWEGIWDGVKGFINKIISGVENMINRVIDGINWLISKLNSLPSIELPGILGGGTIGFNLPTLAPVALPRLAQGAVIPPNREFMAILGDQKRGVNIETPLETMIQAFKTALSEMGGMGQDINLDLTVEMDGEVAYRSHQRVAARHGRSLMPGVTG